MDRNILIAIAMLLASAVAGLMKGAISGADLKEVLILVGGGIMGVANSLRTSTPAKPSGPPLPPTGAIALAVTGALLLAGCGTAPPLASWDRCTTGRVIDACNPADHPPLALDRRTWPFPHIEEEPPQPQTEDTPASRLLKKLGK